MKNGKINLMYTLLFNVYFSANFKSLSISDREDRLDVDSVVGESAEVLAERVSRELDPLINGGAGTSTHGSPIPASGNKKTGKEKVTFFFHFYFASPKNKVRFNCIKNN